MALMENVKQDIALKKELLDICIQIQTNLANTKKEAMEQAQQGANEEKGASEDKYESFREQCMIDREMYAKQLQETLSSFSTLKMIEAAKINDQVKLGSVVITDFQAFFIAISLGEVEVEDKKFFVISTQSPLYQAMAGKKKGETFSFRNKNHKILDVF